MIWLIALALAQEPTPAEPAAAYEVTVWGEAAVSDARARVVRALEAHGWRRVGQGEDPVRLRAPKRWIGRAKLSRDGELTFWRPPVALASAEDYEPPSIEMAPAFESQYTPVGEDGRSGVTGMVSFVFPSPAKVGVIQTRVLEAVRPELMAYREVVRNTAFQGRLLALPARLDALWEAGTPLSGGAVLETRRERRAAVLTFWAARPSGPEGDAESRATEIWLREVVQSSPDPVTPEERAASEAARRDDRPLAL